MLFTAALAISFTGPCGNKEFDQCGGKSFTGNTCCQTYDNCTVINDFYSQCQPMDLCLTPMYGQCGGIDPKTQKQLDPKKACCPDSFDCNMQNPYYSQCLPSNKTTNCAQPYTQCGGKDGTGKPWGTLPTEKTCCNPGFECHEKNEYFSLCNPVPRCGNARYGQCGGQDDDGHPWTSDYGHDTCCPEPFQCTYQSAYFSQCKPSTESDTAYAKITK